MSPTLYAVPIVQAGTGVGVAVLQPFGVGVGPVAVAVGVALAPVAVGVGPVVHAPSLTHQLSEDGSSGELGGQSRLFGIAAIE
jgi:hypothetical protein